MGAFCHAMGERLTRLNKIGADSRGRLSLQIKG